MTDEQKKNFREIQGRLIERCIADDANYPATTLKEWKRMQEQPHRFVTIHLWIGSPPNKSLHSLSVGVDNTKVTLDGEVSKFSTPLYMAEIARMDYKLTHKVLLFTLAVLLVKEKL